MNFRNGKFLKRRMLEIANDETIETSPAVKGSPTALEFERSTQLLLLPKPVYTDFAILRFCKIRANICICKTKVF